MITMIEKVTMAERMIKIETKVDNIETNISDIKCMLIKHIDQQTHEINRLDNKYANKWVEKAIISLMITVSAGIIIGLISLL